MTMTAVEAIRKWTRVLESLDRGELTGDEILALCPILIADHRLAIAAAEGGGKEERQMLRLIGKVRTRLIRAGKAVVAHQKAMLCLIDLNIRGGRR